MESSKIAVVTGGASGIGEACSIRLNMDGYKVIVADIDNTKGKLVADKVMGEYISLDISNSDDISEKASYIWDTFGPVEILVNCAGILQKGPLKPNELNIEDWDRLVTIDQRGTFLACVEFGILMSNAEYGSIINIASVTGMRSVPLHGYAPAKAAVISMTACLAAEWGGSGVRVNCVSPGYTRTPAISNAIERKDRSEEAILANTALRRWVEPEEVANVVSFLASSQSSAMTGVNLPVDAGWLAASSWSTYGGIR
ncbi:SDR family oxidoreductase [Halomonas aquamarina]|uniref:SDR family NAD(P)-dependent oxidoreductase n=1 Tax=Vreelandella aquamarina TaxID=77097 RepID=UPI0023596EEB|nr:SDR family oxidoreductase [Halomonas aquamarina]MDC8442665.1 SDR family oxidoreductase [Halomonas aquamarina]